MNYVSLEDAAQNGWEPERTYLCHAHDDSKASASLNSNGFYICYACGDRGRLDMSKIQITPKGVRMLVSRVAQKLYPAHKNYSESWLGIFDSEGPGDYWLRRFDLETCKHYRLGHTSERSTYPMRGDNGEVLGVVYRTNGPNKYLYPPGVKVTDYLFDFHRLESGDLVLTEGATDAMACWEVGVPAGTASYRNGLSSVQVDKITKYNPRVLWIAYDNDPAGNKGYLKIKNLFPGTVVKRLVWPYRYKDLCEMPQDFRKEILDQVLI